MPAERLQKESRKTLACSLLVRGRWHLATDHGMDDMHVECDSAAHFWTLLGC
jgi:thiamine monophosphate synthase